MNCLPLVYKAHTVTASCPLLDLKTIWFCQRLVKNISTLYGRPVLTHCLHTSSQRDVPVITKQRCSCLLCALEPMWTCYVAFCLERVKRKTNVQELKEKVSEYCLILKWSRLWLFVCSLRYKWNIYNEKMLVAKVFESWSVFCVCGRGRGGYWVCCSVPMTPRCWKRTIIKTG